MEEQVYKKLYRLGAVAYVLLLAFSIVFYKERTVFVDLSYHLFYILKDGYFAIQNYRFGAIVTQVFPLLGSKFGLSLDSIAKLYSAGFIIYYFTCYLLCGMVLKNYRMALVLLLCHTLFVTDTFYWAQSELPQGMAIMCVVLAYLSMQDRCQLQGIPASLVYAGVLTMAFVHPLLVFPVIYSILYFLLRKDNGHKKDWISVGVFYIAVLVIKNIAFKTPYDAQAMGGLKNFVSLFPDYFNIAANKTFLHNCIRKYYWIPIIFTWVTIFYAGNRRWKELLLFAGFSAGFLLMINVSYAYAGAADFYMENLYLPLGIFLAIPLIYDVLPAIPKKNIAGYVLVVILITGAARIYTNHGLYTRRLNWERNLLDRHVDEKIVADAKDYPVDTLLMTWGTPYEFWLLSTIEKGKTASIIINEKPSELVWALDNNDAFLTTWGLFDYKDLPARYFIFTDTVSKYKLVQ